VYDSVYSIVSQLIGTLLLDNFRVCGILASFTPGSSAGLVSTCSPAEVLCNEVSTVSCYCGKEVLRGRLSVGLAGNVADSRQSYGHVVGSGSDISSSEDTKGVNNG
jgi:hypothetical protein